MLHHGRRIAAIDIGTNSIHMIIAERRDGGIRVVDREKEMVQLGLGSLDGQPLTAEAVERGVRSLARMRDIARDWAADEIVAVATSAVREAPNRREFLRRARDEAGIVVEVITGEREAEYIFAAVRNEVEISGRRGLTIDIGGGSVELIASRSRRIDDAVSLPLGALRLAQRFSLIDKVHAKSLKACRAHVCELLEEETDELFADPFDVCIGTSGTILALARIGREDDGEPQALRTLSRSDVAEAAEEMASMQLDERAERFAVHRRRATSLVAGALVLDEIMKAGGVESLVVSTAAMREGIVEAQLRPRSRASASVRRSSVTALARRTGCDIAHARHVAKLAMRIFDQLREVHHLSESSRELLAAAAMLHESGMHVSDRSHEQHSEYIIRNAGLKGFTDEQIGTIASVARFYRKAPPAEWSGIPESRAGEARMLTAILRVAEALDRGHRQRVRDVIVDSNERSVDFLIHAREGASVETTSAKERGKYFAKAFGMRTKFGVASE